MPTARRGRTHLELHRVHGLADQEQVALAQRAVRLQEVRLEVDVEQVAGHTLDRVVQRQDVHLLAVRHVLLRRDRHNVTQTHAEVFIIAN